MKSDRAWEFNSRITPDGIFDSIIVPTDYDMLWTEVLFAYEWKSISFSAWLWGNYNHMESSDYWGPGGYECVSS